MGLGCVANRTQKGTTVRIPTRITAIAVGVALLATTPAAYAGSEDWTGSGLARQLADNGHHFSVDYGGTLYDDYGLTLDGVLALDATGVAKKEAMASTHYVGDHLADYIGYSPDAYAGATAKALVVARAQRLGNAPTGLNLLTQLKSLETATGRFSDKSAWGDYSNTFSQSFALIALKKAGATASRKSVAYLKLQQCPNGGFRETEADTACTDNTKADPDATAIAIQGLVATPKTLDRAKRIFRAASYLVGLQNNGGGIKGGPGQVPNANTTGLAALSLQTAGRYTAAAKARGFLKAVRYGCAFPAPMRGLIAYDKARFAEAKSQGAAAVVTDQDRRASTQAALGLAKKALVWVSNADSIAGLPSQTC